MNQSEINWDRDGFSRCVEALSDPQEVRVWSLIVSLFGDMAPQAGDRIGGTALGRIGTAAGLRPEAVRVALHRLRQDGWIESRRDGRRSSHTLSARARAETQAATPAIYAKSPDTAADWHLIATSEDARIPAGYTRLFRGLALGSGPVESAPAGLICFALGAAHIPEAERTRIFSEDLCCAAQNLETALTGIQAWCARSGGTDPLPTHARAALRMLIVHRWRRLLLRFPALPAEFAPRHFAGERCRELTHDLLARLPRPTPEMLEYPRNFSGDGVGNLAQTPPNAG